MNTPVSYELAKLLKEKGFDKPTQKAYINNKLFKNFEESSGECEYYFHSDDFYEDWNKKGWVYTEKGQGCFGCKLDNLNYFEAYAAPTITEVVMWLYEKRGIWVAVDAGINGFHAHYKANPVGTLSSNLKQGWVNDESNPLPSPKEAYETAIKYCLTKLIK